MQRMQHRLWVCLGVCALILGAVFLVQWGARVAAAELPIAQLPPEDLAAANLPPYGGLLNQPWNANVRVNDTARPPATTPRDEPTLAGDTDSAELFAVWVDGRNGDGTARADTDLLLRRSPDGGSTWGDPLLVGRSAPGRAQSAPDATLAVSGRLHVAWVERWANELDAGAIFYAYSDDDGMTWSVAERLNDVVDSRAIEPAIAVSGSSVCVTWSDDRTNEFFEIYVDCSTNGGMTWRTDVRISSGMPGTAHHRNPDIAFADSRVHVVWEDYRRGSEADVYYAYRSGATWSANVRISHGASGSTQEFPVLATHNRALYVVWRDSARLGGAINGNVSGDAGDTWLAADQEVSDLGGVSARPALTVDSGGTPVAAWRVVSGTHTLLYADRRGLTNWDTDELVVDTTSSKQHLTLAAGSSRVNLAWSTGAAIVSAYRTTTWSAQATVSDQGEARQQAPALAAGTLNYYAAWLDYRSDLSVPGVRVATSTDGGRSWGTNVAVNDAGHTAAVAPALAATGALTVHAAWLGSANIVYYDRSSDGGATWGTDVNLSGGAGSIDVAADGNNGVYVVWPGIFMARSLDGGTTWGTAVRIIGQIFPLVDPALAVGNAGTLHLAWAEAGGNQDVCHGRSTDRGVTWTDVRCFSSPYGTAQTQPDIAVDPISGRVHATWQDERDGVTAIYHAYSSDNGVTWSIPARVNDTRGAALAPRLVVGRNPLDSSRVVYIVWQDTRDTGHDDIFYARSTDQGVTWGAAGRVNDDSLAERWPQRAPAITANANGDVLIGWEDLRRSTWDIFATTIAPACPVPLYRAGMIGDWEVDPGAIAVLTGTIDPLTSTTPLHYIWEPSPHRGQGTTATQYTWPDPGVHEITFRAANCGGTLAATHTLTVTCPAAITAVSMTDVNTAEIHSLVRLSAHLTPAVPYEPITYIWSPEPDAGQNTSQAHYTWHTLGSRTITLTVSNCSGIWGVFSTTQTIQVVDTQLPVWSDFKPTGWLTQTTGPQLHAITAEEYVTMSVRVQDVGSGLDVSTAQAMFTTNGGSSWTAYEDVYCPGGDGTLTLQKINHTHDFGQDSTYMHLNRVRFRIADMVGNYSYSPAYNIDIDTTPPLNPTTITGDRATSAWSNDNTATMSWSYASDASSGVYGYSYQWSMSSTTLPDALTDTVGTSANTTIPSNGNAWYFHVRTVDNAGHWAESATHKGPYWLDTSAPQLPTITSVDPPTGTVSSDNTITVVYNSLDVGPSGIAGYSRSWTQNATDIPDDTLDTGNTSPILSNGTWYFHVKARDRAGNWSATRHIGPFLIESTVPAVIFLDHGNGSPGSDVYVTGLGYAPNVTVTLSFRRQPYPIVPFTPLGDFLTSPDGTFQVLATVPIDAVSVPSEFRAESSEKIATADFNVTENMTLVLQPNRVRPGQNFTVQASGMNPNGSLYIETDLGHALGAFPLNGATSKTQQIHISSAENYSATHILTATVRVGGTVVMRKTATFAVYQTAISVPPPAWITTAITHGIRGDTIGVTGYHNWADLGSCVIDPEYWHGQTDVTGKHIFVPDADGSGGEYWCGKPTYQVTLREVGSVGHGVPLYPLANPGPINVAVTFPDHYIDASVASTMDVPLWPIDLEFPYGQYEICLAGKLEVTESYEQLECSGMDSQGNQTCSWVTKYTVYTLHREVLTCTPFRLDPAPRFTGSVVLHNDNGFISPDDLPQIIVTGKTIGTLAGTHPVAVDQIFAAVSDQNIHFDLPEGAYEFTAFACNHIPKPNLRMPGRGQNWLQNVELLEVHESGPAILGVEAQIQSYLDDSGFGKIGPFLSLQGVPHSLPPLSITFRIRFDTNFETIENVRAELAGQDTEWATQDPTDPNYWNLTWPNLHTLPAGELNMRFIAHGNYKGGCGQQPPADGPEFIVPIVMAAAPPWLKAPSWSGPFGHEANITYNPGTGVYEMDGVVGIADHPVPIDLGFLGSIDNGAGAALNVQETFDTRTGVWTADADAIGGVRVLCYSAMPASLREKCARGYTMHFTAVPAGGTVQVAGQPSYPVRYTGATQPIINESFGPFEVYNGMIASYWGVVNVNLSISFGARAFMNLTPEMEADLAPALTFTPGAQFTGSISLWVDILMGVASAGVTAEPSLGLAFPITLDTEGFDVDGPQACLRLRGSVWFQALWWEEEFGPATILEVQSSPGACGIFPMAQVEGFCYANSTPPPTTMPAPSLATDGAGHLLATWIHDASDDPAKSEGTLYAVYFNGAEWGEPMVAAGDDTYLISDPAVAFAGNDVAVVIYAVNNRNTTNPADWDAVNAQLYYQRLEARVWNGTDWLAPYIVASGGGPHGRVSLAGDPINNRAMALWIHDVSTPATKKWQVEYSVFDGETGAWTARAPITSAAPNPSPPPNGSIDAEVALDFDSAGRVMATWVRQGGILASDDDDPEEYSAFNRNDQRRLVVATWEPATDAWAVSVGPPGLPTGALMPDVAFDDGDQPVLAYALYLTDRDGETPTGLGNNNHLGYAVGTALGANRLASAQAITWEARVAPYVRGVEQPRVVILPEEQASVVYRGFNAQTLGGAITALTIDLRPLSDLYCTLPGSLSKNVAWMIDALAYKNLGSGLTSLVSVAAFPGSSEALGALPGVSIQNVGLPGDDVMAVHVPVLPDLAISTEALRLTETLPLSGTLVPVSVTVRNLGLARTHQPVMVQLLAQHVATGKETLIGSDTVPVDLMFNGTFTLSGAWPARAGLHRIIARVSPPLADDVDGSNNEVHVLVGAPAQPTGLTGSRNTADASITLTWRPETGAALGHYRIYRAAAGGELLWLADSTAAWFRDTSVESSTTYTYTVSAVSDAGVESPQSAELSIGPGLRYVYLPLVLRQP